MPPCPSTVTTEEPVLTTTMVTTRSVVTFTEVTTRLTQVVTTVVTSTTVQSTAGRETDSSTQGSVVSTVVTVQTSTGVPERSTRGVGLPIWAIVLLVAGTLLIASGSMVVTIRCRRRRLVLELEMSRRNMEMLSFARRDAAEHVLYDSTCLSQGVV
jgi:heme A synthase